MILFLSGLLICVSSYLIILIPSKPSLRRGESNPLKNLSQLLKDRMFGLITLAWFFGGLASLVVTPLRVVYLASSPPRGLDLSPLYVLIIVGIIPNAVRLLFTWFWAYFFDRVNFVVLRIIMTLFVGVGNLIFFTTVNYAVLICASVIIYIGYSGTFLVWNLWVTKIAPPGRSQLYMSVHSFSTGIRGIAGPFIGFLFINQFSIRNVGFLSFALVLISVVLLLPLIRQGAQLRSTV